MRERDVIMSRGSDAPTPVATPPRYASFTSIACALNRSESRASTEEKPLVVRRSFEETDEHDHARVTQASGDRRHGEQPYSRAGHLGADEVGEM